MKILVTGSNGFVGGYIVNELLNNDYSVVGIDNFSKYGKVLKSYDDNPKYLFKEGDCKNSQLIYELLEGCDYIIACAAMIGGISYFHEFAYDLIAENERIIASTFDAAIKRFKKGSLKKIIVLSSSMVFENSTIFPSSEDDLKKTPSPLSTYGFQKLSTEYFAKGALEQFGLPYTIVRPFNCVGIGEGRAISDKDIMSGNVKLALSHVLPDLIQKILKGQNPLKILGSGSQIRHYTHGKDLARGIRLAIESPLAKNEDFNISTDKSTTVLELARMVWNCIHKGNLPFKYELEKGFEYDVQKRIPDTSKAKRLLNFEAEIKIQDSISEVTEWISNEIKHNRM